MHFSFEGGRGVTLLPAPLPAIPTKGREEMCLEGT